MPKVSVIIPNYNHSAYLKQRIESVLNQTYTDFEVIILDDCSTDNSKDIIEVYKNNSKVINVVYNEVNSGNTFKQWDKGIQLAKGDFVWIAESDDWCEPDFLQTIMQGIQKNKNVVFGYCQSFCVDDTGRIIFQSNHSKLEDYCDKNKFLESFLCFGNAVFNASMAVFKKNMYHEINDFYKTFKFTGDWIFWAQLSRLGTVYINARPLNYFRKHTNDVSSKMYINGLNFMEEIKALNYMHENLQLKNKLYLKAKIKLYNRYIISSKSMDKKIKTATKSLFLYNLSFIQKQYFLGLSGLYKIKKSLS